MKKRPKRAVNMEISINFQPIKTGTVSNFCGCLRFARRRRGIPVSLWESGAGYWREKKKTSRDVMSFLSDFGNDVAAGFQRGADLIQNLLGIGTNGVIVIAAGDVHQLGGLPRSYTFDKLLDMKF